MMEKQQHKTARHALRVSGERIARWLARHWRTMFGAALAVTVGMLTIVCVHLWYGYVRMHDIAQDDMNAYIATKQQETAFRRDEFDALKNAVEERRARFSNVPQFYDNMFHY